MISHKNRTQSAVAARGSRIANIDVRYQERCCSALFRKKYAHAIHHHIYHNIFQESKVMSRSWFHSIIKVTVMRDSTRIPNTAILRSLDGRWDNFFALRIYTILHIPATNQNTLPIILVPTISGSKRKYNHKIHINIAIYEAVPKISRTISSRYFFIHILV